MFTYPLHGVYFGFLAMVLGNTPAVIWSKTVMARMLSVLQRKKLAAILVRPLIMHDISTDVLDRFNKKHDIKLLKNVRKVVLSKVLMKIDQ